MPLNVMHPSSSFFVDVAMAALALLVAGLLVLGHARAGARSSGGAWRFGAGVAAWVVIVAAAGLSGVLKRADLRPPPMGVMVVSCLVLAIASGLSRVGKRMATGLPIAALIGFHAFRLPLELVMHRAASEGTMPVQMSFGGSNFDIITGITAILVAALAHAGKAPRLLLQGWAILSSVLLAAIVVIAVASTPPLAAFGSAPERLNTWVAWFPFCWLPALLVPAALFGQILVFRRLAAIPRG